jgi:hypothetical protein
MAPQSLRSELIRFRDFQPFLFSLSRAVFTILTWTSDTKRQKLGQLTDIRKIGSIPFFSWLPNLEKINWPCVFRLIKELIHPAPDCGLLWKFLINGADLQDYSKVPFE